MARAIPTQRELQVLAVWMRTGTAKDTAAHLGITEQGVKNRLESLRRRVGAANTAQAFAICVERGFLTKAYTNVHVRTST